MANENSKKPKGLYVGKQIKLKYYKSGGTANGYHFNNCTHDIGEYDATGTYILKARCFLTFWGDYNLKEDDTITIEQITTLEEVKMYKTKNGTYIPTIVATIIIKSNATPQQNVPQQNSTDEHYYNGGVNYSGDEYL